MQLSPTQPHVEIWNTECYGPHAYADVPSNDKHAFAMLVTLFGAQSRGQVTIESQDPRANPVVDHSHLKDPRDSVVLAEGCMLANEIVTESSTLKDVVVGGWPKGAVHHEWNERGKWEEHVRRTADTCLCSPFLCVVFKFRFCTDAGTNPGYHPAGTCAMGLDNDPNAVLDPELRVRGVRGLRVVDASVMPLLMGGHPQMTVYAIAEKAADLVKESWK